MLVIRVRVTTTRDRAAGDRRPHGVSDIDGKVGRITRCAVSDNQVVGPSNLQAHSIISTYITLDPASLSGHPNSRTVWVLPAAIVEHTYVISNDRDTIGVIELRDAVSDHHSILSADPGISVVRRTRIHNGTPATRINADGAVVSRKATFDAQPKKALVPDDRFA